MMALGFITTISHSYKTTIELQLLKRVPKNQSGSLIRRQDAQILQELSSMLMKVPCILKAMHVVLLLYL